MPATTAQRTSPRSAAAWQSSAALEQRQTEARRQHHQQNLQQRNPQYSDANDDDGSDQCRTKAANVAVPQSDTGRDVEANGGSTRAGQRHVDPPAAHPAMR